MGYCLWMGGKKVYSIHELIENFDITSVRGYFLGGSLIKWLTDENQPEIIQRLNSITVSKNMDEQLYGAFGLAFSPVLYHKNKPLQNTFTLNSPTSFSTGSSSFKRKNFSFHGSFKIPSAKTSFITSFYGGYKSSFSRSFSSSFPLTFSASFSSSYSAKIGSFDMMNITSSFPINIKNKYEENIALCPLNRFGYGIHIIK